MCGGHAPYPTYMPFGVSSGIPNVIIHAKFQVDRLRGFWAEGPPKCLYLYLLKRPLQQSCTGTVQTVINFMQQDDISPKEGRGYGRVTVSKFCRQS